MNRQPDEKWMNLLSHSAPTFAGEDAPPYGFVTSTLGRLRVEKRQQEEIERTGWRALLASLVALAAVVTLTVGLQLQDGNDFDPGVKSIIETENVSVS
jgi:hypothetical protein